MAEPLDLAQAYKQAEYALILNESLDNATQAALPSEVVTLVDHYLHGRYTEILTQNSPVFPSDHNADATSHLLATGNVEKWIDAHVGWLDMSDAKVAFQGLITGVACLQAFVQTNWTGPTLAWPVSSLFLDKADAKLDEAIHRHCLKSLSVDSEQVYHLAERLGVLAAALAILLSPAVQKATATAAFWAMRATFVQQQLLDEKTGTLHTLLLKLASDAADAFGVNEPLDQLSPERSQLRVRHQLEQALILSYFGQDKDAYGLMKEAQTSSGFAWSLTGALGRRTKFQQFDVSQLVVLAESKPRAGGKQQVEASKPETIELEDDTLLDHVKYADTDVNQKEANQRHGNIAVIDQCLLLAFCTNVKNTNPEHGLTATQMTPYVVRVLENPNNWMVHTMGLLLRSRLESNKSRTVERAALQLQALVDQIKVEDSGAEERLAYFYDLLLPSKWEMERELARRFISLGVIRSALEIFERLELWEDVVACYQMLEQPTKAKEVLAKLMAEQPDPKLWCILGDVEQNPEHWREAWSMSGGRSARAMRSLGAYLYKKQEFQECIECYERALAINPLFEGSWYVMGCAGMQAENWPVALRAFQRVVALDNEQAEAWNNLASIYLQLDRKPDAFLALKQATKLKFDNWKMWQNLLFVAVDVGQFPDAIWAMQRIVELLWDKRRDQAVDVQVLQLLVDNVVQNWKDPFERDGARLARQVQRLLEEVILTRITNSPDIWRVCAKYYMWQKRYKDALDASVKAYRAVMHDARLETELDVFERVATIALETVDSYESLGDLQDKDGVVCADWKYQARLVLKGLMGKARDNFEDTPIYERLQERLEDLKRS